MRALESLAKEKYLSTVCDDTTAPQTAWVRIPAKGTFLFNSHLSNCLLFLLLLSWPLTVKNPIANKKSDLWAVKHFYSVIVESCKKLQQENKEISHVSHTFLSHCHFRILSFRTFSCLSCVYFYFFLWIFSRNIWDTVETKMRNTWESQRSLMSLERAIKYFNIGVQYW